MSCWYVWQTHGTFTCAKHTCLVWCAKHTCHVHTCDTHMSRVMSHTHVSFTCVTHTCLEYRVTHTYFRLCVWQTYVTFTCVTHTCLVWCVTHTRLVYMCDIASVVWHTRVSCVCVTHTRHVYMCDTQKPIGYRVHDLYTYNLNLYYVGFISRKNTYITGYKVHDSYSYKLYLVGFVSGENPISQDIGFTSRILGLLRIC